MSSLGFAKLRYAGSLVLIAVVMAAVLAPLLNILIWPPLVPVVPKLALLVTLIVAPPLCCYAAHQHFKTRAAQEALQAQQTDLIAARTAAEEAAAARARFLAVMSHEIRTPLNGLLGLAQVLAARPLEVEDRRLVDVLNSTGQDLLVLLNDVLDMSKIEAGKLEIVPVSACIRTEISKVVELFGGAARQKSLALDLSISDEIPECVLIDPVRVRQCLSNLISNAIKFTDEGGVFVSVGLGPRSGGDTLVIEVEDTGCGISPTAQSKIFETFGQADSSIAGKYGGTGLGLAICKQLAAKMGGDLMVTSWPGEGARFRLTLALETVTDLTSSKDVLAPRLMLTGRRLLIVDDTDTNRLVARMFLQPTGVELLEASDGVDALDVLSREPVDLVLLDMQMPNMDGRETTRRIRKAHGEAVAIIVMTAGAIGSDQQDYIALGADGFASKPIDQRAFEAEIARVIALHGRRTQRDAA